MPSEFKMTRMVEFVETDMAGIMHFSNFFRFMEATEHAFFRSLGSTLHEEVNGVMTGWARVQAQCEYLKPARYQDELQVHLLVREKTPLSITYSFHFRRLDCENNASSKNATENNSSETIARGQLKVVCVQKQPGEQRIKASPIPADLYDLIEIAPA